MAEPRDPALTRDGWLPAFRKSPFADEATAAPAPGGPAAQLGAPPSVFQPPWLVRQERLQRQAAGWTPKSVFEAGAALFRDQDSHDPCDPSSVDYNPARCLLKRAAAQAGAALPTPLGWVRADVAAPTDALPEPPSVQAAAAVERTAPSAAALRREAEFPKLARPARAAAAAGEDLPGTQPLVGFYSPLQRLLEERLRGRKSVGVDELRAIVQKQAKPDEVRWTGILWWLDEQERQGRRSLPSEEVLTAVERGQLRVQERLQGLPEHLVGDPAYERLLDRRQALVETSNRLAAERQKLIALAQEERRQGRREQANALTQQAEALRDRYDRVMDELFAVQEAIEQTRGTLLPNWEPYTLPGGGQYRELVVSLAETPDVRALFPPGDPGPFPSARVRQEEPWFGSVHFSDPNLVAHVRFKDRVDREGRRALVVEELQSDWQQLPRFGPKGAGVDFGRGAGMTTGTPAGTMGSGSQAESLWLSRCPHGEG